MASTRKIVVRQSRVHGKGVFAVKRIRKGTRIAELRIVPPAVIQAA